MCPQYRGICEEDLTILIGRLKGYRLAYDLEVLEYGCYVRWYPLSGRGPSNLRAGGLIIEVKLGDSGTMVVCRNATGRIFQFCFEQCLVFRKLSPQERLILRGSRDGRKARNLGHGR